MPNFSLFIFCFGWRRIWRTRCTSQSRGDARCWRISTTPKTLAKHQHPFIPTTTTTTVWPLPPPALIPFVHSLFLTELAYLLHPPTTTTTPSMLSSSSSSSSSSLRCRVTEWHNCKLPTFLVLLLASWFWLQSVTFCVVSLAGAFHVWLRRGNFEIWPRVNKHRVIFWSQY